VLPSKFHHLGVAVAELRPAIESYAELFGYRLVSGPFDDPIQKVSVCFLAKGDEGEALVELVAPLSDDSPINRTLKKGGGAYHLCYEVEDLDEALRRLAEKGCIVVAEPVPAVAFGGRRIAWLFTPTRQLVELIDGITREKVQKTAQEAFA
jgi:methylmalonyl-CoA/ethylmalonyl-CoA epimerase